jgi:hypothetical protein
MRRGTKKLPVSREGWRDFYIAEFNKHGREASAHLALFYMFLIEGLS